MARVGDVTVNFGVLGPVPPIAGIFVNGQPATGMEAPVSPHPPCPYPPTHCYSFVIEGAATVLLNGVPATYVGAFSYCGHPIMTGAAAVNVSSAG